MRPVHIVNWRYQLGSATTLPLLKRTLILVWPEYRCDQGLIDHEMCHTRQVERWGVLGYYCRHLAQRLSPASCWRRLRAGGIAAAVLATDCPAERECYDSTQPDGEAPIR